MSLARSRAPRARGSWIVLLAIALVVTGSTAGWARNSSRVVVRYAETVDACMHCLLARGVPVSRFTGTSSLDDLHHALGVRGATELFLEHHRATGGRAAAWALRTDAVRARFPVRAGRHTHRAARHADSRPDTSLAGIYVLDLPNGTDVDDAARRLAADPSVVWAEPEMVRSATYLPNDQYLATSGTWGQSYPDLWGLLGIGAPAAWDVTRGAGIVVAVVDTGLHTKHRDIAANVWTNPGEIRKNKIDDDGNGYVDDEMGWDFVRDRKSIKDGHGHGTHVAGTIAAVCATGLCALTKARGPRIHCAVLAPRSNCCR